MRPIYGHLFSERHRLVKSMWEVPWLGTKDVDLEIGYLGSWLFREPQAEKIASFIADWWPGPGRAEEQLSILDRVFFFFFAPLCSLWEKTMVVIKPRKDTFLSHFFFPSVIILSLTCLWDLPTALSHDQMGHVKHRSNLQPCEDSSLELHFWVLFTQANQVLGALPALGKVCSGTWSVC